MKTNLQTLVTLAATVALGCSARAASLSYDFATGASGTNGGGFNGGTYAWSSSLQAVQHTATTGGWNLGGTGPKFEFAGASQTIMQGYANTGGILSFDLLVTPGSFAGTNWLTGNYFQLHFAGNSDGSSGWTQDANGAFGANPVSGSFSPSSPAIQTFHFDLTFAQAGWQPGDTWFQVFFGANSDAANPVQFYVDNLRVTQVPEPGSYALAGLGIAALLLFRRRK